MGMAGYLVAKKTARSKINRMGKNYINIMINKDIKRKIALLQDYLNNLAPYTILPTEELLKK